MIRKSTLFWCVLALGSSAILYHTSYRVQALQSELGEVNAQIASEQERIHVLNAEWAYLTTPARIQKLAARHLPTQAPAKTYQVVSMAELTKQLPPRPDLAPAQPQIMAQATAKTAPVRVAAVEPAPAPVPVPARKTPQITAPRPATAKPIAIAALSRPATPPGTQAQPIAYRMAANTDQIGALINALDAGR